MSEWTREEQKKHSAEWTRQYEKGQQDAEERIIKLLEADAGECIQTKPANEHLDDYCNCRLIALIKGENK